MRSKRAWMLAWLLLGAAGCGGDESGPSAGDTGADAASDGAGDAVSDSAASDASSGDVSNDGAGDSGGNDGGSDDGGSDATTGGSLPELTPFIGDVELDGDGCWRPAGSGEQFVHGEVGVAAPPDGSDAFVITGTLGTNGRIRFTSYAMRDGSVVSEGYWVEIALLGDGTFGGEVAESSNGDSVEDTCVIEAFDGDPVPFTVDCELGWAEQGGACSVDVPCGTLALELETAASWQGSVRSLSMAADARVCSLTFGE